MSNKNTPSDILNDAFAPKKGDSPKGGYDHPHEDAIIAGARKILNFTPTGQELLKFADEANLKIRVLKDSKSSGYIPSSEVAIVTAPATQKNAAPQTVLNFIRALREAEQEQNGFTRPDPRYKDVYIERGLEKEQDIISTQFLIAYELKKHMKVDDLLDSMEKEGHTDINKAINDLETKSG